MNEYKFKSTINCNNCVARVTPILNSLPNVNSWKVDLQHEDRTLTVSSDSDEFSPDDIKSSLAKIGFKAESI